MEHRYCYKTFVLKVIVLTWMCCSTGFAAEISGAQDWSGSNHPPQQIGGFYNVNEQVGNTNPKVSGPPVQQNTYSSQQPPQQPHPPQQVQPPPQQQQPPQQQEHLADTVSRDDDSLEYPDVYNLDSASYESGTGVAQINHNDLSNQGGYYPPIPLPGIAPAYYGPSPGHQKPDYLYKFKWYPAVGYHKDAEIIYLDDHDYYHPYYTPGGYESLKTVKKSVSKIQKELKKATKFQPHYDHLYGKGRVKQYLISKPPHNYGPSGSYGVGKKAYHTPHPITGADVGNIDDYLNYDFGSRASEFEEKAL